MSKQTFRVVKMTVKTGCDLEREVIKANLPKGKAQAMKAVLENKNMAEDFDPAKPLVSYLVEPAA